jgi:hypothetical protein
MSVIPLTNYEIDNRSPRNLITNNLTGKTQFSRYMQPDPEDTLIALRQEMEQYLHSTDVDCMPCRGSE